MAEQTSNVDSPVAESTTVKRVRKTAKSRSTPRKRTGSNTTQKLRKTATVSLSARKTRARAAAAPRNVSALNRLVNVSVVVAIFVVALAIQRVMPLGPTPKAEPLAKPAATALPVETATVPAITTPITDNTIVAPAAVTPVAVTKKVVARKAPRTTSTPASGSRAEDYHVPLNAGGTSDLDSEAARQVYLEKNKVATRSEPKK